MRQALGNKGPGVGWQQGEGEGDPWQCSHTSSSDHSSSPGKIRGSGDVDLSSSARERQQVKPHHPINILLQ